MVVLLDPSDDPDDILRQNRNREKQYVFDHVFDAIATQEQVYEKTTKGGSFSIPLWHDSFGNFYSNSIDTVVDVPCYQAFSSSA